MASSNHGCGPGCRLGCSLGHHLHQSHQVLGGTALRLMCGRWEWYATGQTAALRVCLARLTSCTLEYEGCHDVDGPRATALRRKNDERGASKSNAGPRAVDLRLVSNRPNRVVGQQVPATTLRPCGKMPYGEARTSPHAAADTDDNHAATSLAGQPERPRVLDKYLL